MVLLSLLLQRFFTNAICISVYYIYCNIVFALNKYFRLEYISVQRHRCEAFELAV